MAVRVPSTNPVTREPASSEAVPEKPAAARDPQAVATRDERRPQAGATPNVESDPNAKAALSLERGTKARSADAARAPERRPGRAAARPPASAGVGAKAPESASVSSANDRTDVDGPPTPVVASTHVAPDTAARRTDGESSIITSAPVLADEPPPGQNPPRASSAKAAPASSAEPGTKERAASPPAGDSASLTGTRAKRDRTKSPGFYSNLAPAHAADKVSSSLSNATLKRTVLGVAPPPELVDGVAAPGRATPPQRGAVAEPAAGASAPTSAAARAAVAPDNAVPGPERRPTASRLTSAAPSASAETEEKEDTSPGLGHTRSRHDPTVRLELPEGDLDLLVDFAMDLGLGLAGQAWLVPAREAVARLRAAAARVQKNGLEKALGQLVVELDAPNVLSEERRGRIQQALVLVDLALPRPMDVPGQRLVRERLIVQHLVSELSASHPRVARWLRDENIVSLDRLGRLGADELAERAEISRDQATQALSAFSDYFEDRSKRGPELSLLGKTRALELRLADLEASAEQFERVADGDDRDAKREARRRRQLDIARLNLFLAERGEAVMLSELERCSVQGKITRLRRWLTEQPASSVRGAVSEPQRQEITG